MLLRTLVLLRDSYLSLHYTVKVLHMSVCVLSYLPWIHDEGHHRRLRCFHLVLVLHLPPVLAFISCREQGSGRHVSSNYSRVQYNSGIAFARTWYEYVHSCHSFE